MKVQDVMTDGVIPVGAEETVDVAARSLTHSNIGALPVVDKGGLCGMLTGNTGSCGVLAFLISLLSLGLGGGILPPVMLPKMVRAMLNCSPVTWLRNLFAVGAGYPVSVGQAMALCIGIVAMTLVTVVLYRRAMLRREDAL